MALDTGLTFSPDRAKPHTMSDSDLRELTVTAGWVHDNAQAVCIIKAESSGRTDATSGNPDGGTNIGLFQIDSKNVSHPDHLYDPVYNANVARRMWSADGGTFQKHWSTFPKCAGTTGFAAPGNEAVPSNVIPNPVPDIAGAIAAILNGIPWYRVGKAAFGVVLLAVGAGAIISTGVKASGGIRVG